MIIPLLEQIPEWMKWATWSLASVGFMFGIGREKIVLVLIALFFLLPAYGGYVAVEQLSSDWRTQLVTGIAIYAFSIYVTYKVVQLSVVRDVLDPVVAVADFLGPVLSAMYCAYQATRYLDADAIVTGILLFVCLFFCGVVVKRHFTHALEGNGGHSHVLQAYRKPFAALFVATFVLLTVASAGAVGFRAEGTELQAGLASEGSSGTSSIEVEVTPVNLIADVLKNARIRALPSTSAEVLGSLTAGGQTPITGRTADGEWYRIEVAGRPGYVHASLLRPWK